MESTAVITSNQKTQIYNDMCLLYSKHHTNEPFYNSFHFIEAVVHHNKKDLVENFKNSFNEFLDTLGESEKSDELLVRICKSCGCT
jgi:hypothetical protein